MNLSDLATTLMRPLTPHELQHLDNFFSRSGGGGALHTATAHGILSASLCGPDLVLPSEFIPLMLCERGEFQCLNQEHETIHLIMRMHKHIHVMLHSNSRFEPLFIARSEGESADQQASQVDAWCRGFLKGMTLRGALWRRYDHSNLRELLLPILALGARPQDIAQEARVILENPTLRGELAGWIPDAVQSIYAFWRKNPVRYAPTSRTSTTPHAGAPINGPTEKRTAQTGKVLH